VCQLHEWAMVGELVRQGVPKQRIAERLGCSRPTVYRLADVAKPPRYGRAAGGSQLNPFKDAIAAMLAGDATMPATGIRQHLPPTGEILQADW